MALICNCTSTSLLCSIADEVADGMAVLISPVADSWSFWNWVNANSRAACVSLVTDPRTGQPASRLLLDYRSAIEDMVLALKMTDLAKREVSKRTLLAKLEKTLLSQLLQAVLVKAQQAQATAAPANAGTCYQSCWKTANMVSQGLSSSFMQRQDICMMAMLLDPAYGTICPKQVMLHGLQCFCLMH
jgi:hypothetical protein